MYEVFAPPFALPRPTQVRTLGKLSKRAPLAPPAFKAPTPLLTMYEVFAPPFALPRPIQVRLLGKLTKAVTVTASSPLPSAPSPLLVVPEAFAPSFALPRPTQGPWVLGALSAPQPAQSAPAFKAPSPLLTGAFAFVRPFEMPRASQNPALAILSRVADVSLGSFPPWKPSPLPVIMASVFAPPFLFRSTRRFIHRAGVLSRPSGPAKLVLADAAVAALTPADVGVAVLTLTVDDC